MVTPPGPLRWGVHAVLLRWLPVLVLIMLAACAPSGRAAAPAAPFDLYLFWAVGCPHCERAMAFLKRLEAREPRLKVHYLEVSQDEANRQAYAAVVEKIRLQKPSVPLMLVGEVAMVGYATDETSGAELERRIEVCLAVGCPDPYGALINPGLPGRGSGGAPPATRTVPVELLPPTIALPVVGEIRTADLSLPALTLILGAIDGFNPCAMWVLVFLIGLLLGMQDRARMWLLGGAFIGASALVYFLFMAAWLNLLLFLGAIVWVRAAVGVVALAGGAWYLREYFVNPAAQCKVTAPQSRRRVFEHLRGLAGESRFWVALTGIVALAFAVNVVELICSAGIPAVYTQVLALSALPGWQYYGYLAGYVLVFMLDDLAVFVVAMKTLKLAGATTGYTRFSHLAGGCVLLVLGGLLLLRPEWLSFA